MVGAYLGTMKAGAVAVPLPSRPAQRPPGRAPSRAAPPTAAIVDASVTADEAAVRRHRQVFVAGRSRSRGRSSGRRSHRWHRQLRRRVRRLRPRVRPIDLDLAAIIYTSGSTGEPRGVMLTHRNFTANARSIVSYLSLQASDRVMCVLPFYYVYGLSLLHTHLAVGGSVVIENRFVFPNVVLKAMHEQAVTGFAGVPSTFALLLHRSDLDSWSCPSLRYVTQAGGAMSSAKIREWCTRGPKVPFYVMYGATEAAARLTYLEPCAARPTSSGRSARPSPTSKFASSRTTAQRRQRTRSESWSRAARTSRSATGAIRWRPDAASIRSAIAPATWGTWTRTAIFFLVGRRHDMLKLGAHRVGAKEIEDVLQEFPAVLEAAVVGAPHDLLGEVAIAFVSLRDGSSASADGLEAFCRSRLASHKIPAQFLLLPDLPKLGAVGKIDKTKLREQARLLVRAPSEPA